MKNVICGTHEQCISALFTADFSQKVRLKQKKKRKMCMARKRNAETWIQTAFNWLTTHSVLALELVCD